MNTKQFLLAWAGFSFCGSVQAAPLEVPDLYTGGTPTNATYNDSDVIGAAGFNVSKAIIDLDGTTLTVDIYTNYVNVVDTGGALGTTYGDLFLNHTWDPDDGPLAEPWAADNAINGTKWGWALHMVGILTGEDGTVTLYELAEKNAGAILSNAQTGYTFRSDQVVQVNTSFTGNKSTDRTGTWTRTRDESISDNDDGINDFLRFQIDLAETSLYNAIMGSSGSGTLAFHWGATCANDVIEGLVSFSSFENPVPEPTALSSGWASG